MPTALYPTTTLPSSITPSSPALYAIPSSITTPVTPSAIPSYVTPSFASPSLASSATPLLSTPSSTPLSSTCTTRCSSSRHSILDPPLFGHSIVIYPARRPSPTFDAASTWACETDYTYESSILRPSPSVRSIGLPEPGGSFDTSFLHPTDSLVSEPLGPQWVERIVSSPSLSVRSSVLQPPPPVTVSPASSITAVIVS